MEIQFLNVDLVIQSSQSLQTLIDELGEDILILEEARSTSGDHFLCFELSGLIEGDANQTISTFCSLIEKLSEKSKIIWDKSYSKKFDIGFQSGDFPKNYQTKIRSNTLNRIADLGANIVVTIYPQDNPDKQKMENEK